MADRVPTLLAPGPVQGNVAGGSRPHGRFFMTYARRETVRGLAALLVAAVVALAAAVALAAPRQWDEDWCKQSWGDGGRARVCEVRELTMSRLPTTLSVTPGDNGGVEVAAGSAGTVRVKARVEAWGKTR